MNICCICKKKKLFLPDLEDRIEKETRCVENFSHIKSL